MELRKNDECKKKNMKNINKKIIDAYLILLLVIHFIE